MIPVTLYVDCKCRMAQASDCGYCKGTGFAPASTDELITAVRAGVESGTIEGVSVESEHDHVWGESLPAVRGVKPGTYIIVGPVSDGGSET